MRLLFIDTETGGVKPESDALLEVALAVWDEGYVIAQKVWKIKSGDKFYRQRALDINHINIEDHNKIAQEPAEAANEIAGFIEEWFPEGHATLAGQNVAFDRDFLRMLIFENLDVNFADLVTHRLLDTMSILNFLHANGLIPAEALCLDGALEHLGIVVTNRHSAMGDVNATIALMDKLSEFLQP